MLNCIRYEDFEKLLSGEHAKYYQGRWEYFHKVISIIKNLDAHKILEIGPGILPIVNNADLLINPEDDQFGRPNQCSGKKIVFDITKKPWPIENKYYDLVIALQVWEHLDNKQTRAFHELKRISKRAVLSFPYEWMSDLEKYSHHLHRDIDKDLIDDWTLNTNYKKEIEIKRTGDEFSKGKRIIRYWQF
jgi:hypothetical protein